MPLRPIRSRIGSCIYELLKKLADILSPLVGGTQYQIKYSGDFVEKVMSLKVHMVQDEELLVSFDVSALFTVPINEALELIKGMLKTDGYLSEWKKLPVSHFVDLHGKLLVQTCCVFRSQVFPQRHEAAMGSPVIVWPTCIIIQDYEQCMLVSLGWWYFHHQQEKTDMNLFRPSKQYQ